MVPVLETEIVKKFKTSVGKAPTGRMIFSKFNWPEEANVDEIATCDVRVKVVDGPVYGFIVMIKPIEKFPSDWELHVPEVGWVTVAADVPEIIYTHRTKAEPGYERQIIDMLRFMKEGDYEGEIHVYWKTEPSTYFDKHESIRFTTRHKPSLELEETNILNQVIKYLKDYWYIPTAIGIGVTCYFIGKKVKK